MPRQEALPEELKELCGLCRAGKLFAVQEWIASGRRYRHPAGRFRTSPLQVSIERGFHSLVEVLLRAGASEEEKCNALLHAVRERNPDLVQLLTEYGANVRAIESDEVFWSRHPVIIRWFVNQGMDLESGDPIAKAFRDKQREFLGIYLDLRDRIPSARKQAPMALRHHAAEGSLKWVSLLLWAGADPRLPVPRIDRGDGEEEEEEEENALNAAVSRGQTEVVKKIGIDPKRDDLGRLLGQHLICPKPGLIELLMSQGVDVVAAGQPPIESVFFTFLWSLDPLLANPVNTEETLRCMELLGARGARWNPDRRRRTWFRTTMGRIPSYRAIQLLQRIRRSRIIDPPTFDELMRTPKMRPLREGFAGAR